MTTIQQQLASKAHTCILEITDDGEKKKYGTMAHKLPILIRTAGLAQALAFVEARGSTAQHKLLDHIAQTIDVAGIDNRGTLTQTCREAPLQQYIFLTRRVMDALVWFKRFTESVLRVPLRDAVQDDDLSDETAVSDGAGG